MSETDPLVEYKSGGQASIISYNVPLPTSYGTRSLIELDFPKEYFRSHARDKPEQTIRDDIADRSFDDIRDRVRTAIDKGFHDPALFGGIDFTEGTPMQLPKPGTIDPVGPMVSGSGMQPGAVGERTVREQEYRLGTVDGHSFHCN